MLLLGRALAAVLQPGDCVTLCGELGAGKTTLSRGILQGLGWSGTVKSPTYTIVEPYETITPPLYHFDLYRLCGDDELDALGFRDYVHDTSICLIEWPEKVAWVASLATWQVVIDACGQGRQIAITGPDCDHIQYEE